MSKITIKTTLAALALGAICGMAFAQADFKDEKAGIDMVFVKGGAFTMGCTKEQEGDCVMDAEKPTRSVTVSDFYIGKYPVTQKQWADVMGGIPSDFRGYDLPVESVSWNDVQQFITKLNSMTGKKYRLPTEAEWEYAARGGASSKGFKYSGSNNVDDVAWYDENSMMTTHAVGGRRPNELGIYDMSGNVWEWVSDWLGKYGSAAQTDPKGPPSGTNRVVRGGNWTLGAEHSRVSDRFAATPGERVNYLGFRLVLQQ